MRERAGGVPCCTDASITEQAGEKETSKQPALLLLPASTVLAMDLQGRHEKCIWQNPAVT